MGKKNRDGILIALILIVLLGLFVAGMSLTLEHIRVQPIGEGEDTGKLEFIPIVGTNDAGTVTMRLKYIPIAKNINLFDYIYEHEESALTNTNHTELFKLSLISEENATRVYKVEKIVNGTFMRILQMSEGMLEHLTSPGDVYEDAQGRFNMQVKSDIGNVYLHLTLSEDGAVKT